MAVPLRTAQSCVAEIAEKELMFRGGVVAGRSQGINTRDSYIRWPAGWDSKSPNKHAWASAPLRQGLSRHLLRLLGAKPLQFLPQLRPRIGQNGDSQQRGVARSRRPNRQR